MKKVLVKGPALSLSGYGEQARFAIQSLSKSRNVDLYLINIPWGKTGQITDEDQLHFLYGLLEKTKQYSESVNGKMSFDISVQVTIPNEFEKIAKYNIGYTAGIETTKVSPEWIDKSNTMDKIIVPSNHSRKVFEETIYKAVVQETKENTEFKLKTPIETCSFPATIGDVHVPDLKLETEWNFLSVAQWGIRKNVEATINNFLKEFKDDKVGLVLKLNMVKNSTMDKLSTQQKVQTAVERFKEENGELKCRVYLLHGSLTDQEMKGLYKHPKIKAFVTTTHGEGFGLPIFDAAIHELPIIAPAWSSYIDFLYAPKKIKGNKEKNKPHFTKIDFDLQKVQKEAVWKSIIQADSQWCFVKDHSVRSAMREVFKNYGPKLSDAKKLSKFVLKNFNQQKQETQFQIACGVNQEEVHLEVEPVTGFSFCIPTNAKRVEKTLLTIESIKRQEWGKIPYEIIVCGDIEPFNDVEGVTFLDKKEEAHLGKVSVLRNGAADNAKHNEIVFCDDDIVLEPEWLKNTLKFSKEQGWKVLGNKMFNPDGTRCWDRCILEPHIMVDYDHPKEDKNLYQSSGFFLIRKHVFQQVRWNEERIVYADRQGGIPEDVQFSLDIVKNGFPISFNSSSLVWHNDESYTEINIEGKSQTLKKDLLREKVGFEYFLPNDLDFKNLMEGLTK